MFRAVVEFQLFGRDQLKQWLIRFVFATSRRTPLQCFSSNSVSAIHPALCASSPQSPLACRHKHLPLVQQNARRLFLFTSRRHRVKGSKHTYGRTTRERTSQNRLTTKGNVDTCPHPQLFKHSAQKRHWSGDNSVLAQWQTLLRPFMVRRYSG